MEKITPQKLKYLIVKRDKHSHKGDYGKVLIIAGSKGMCGAAILAAKAALKAGAGLVTIACPKSERFIITTALPEAMTLPLSDKGGALSLKAAGEILKWQKIKKYDLALIGPGLSLSKEAPLFIIEVIKKLQIPMIIDADALNALSLFSATALPRLNACALPRIMTPHLGEIRRLLKTDSSDRKKLAFKLSEKTGAVIIMKGNKTIVKSKNNFYENTTGGPVLSKGGSGDVLAGLIAGIWAQSGKLGGYNDKTAFESSVLGVYLHGLCGDLASEKLTERCVLAGELLDFLPTAYRRIISK
ncbi:MAG: NAD(P)H-hydrate dehydratase [Elusimicrobia bacterium]|nr:NAD(P)H-hydrate dehydratase [Elusimicrobiota bacterium]